MVEETSHLEDDEVIELDFPRADILSDVGEVLMYALDDDLCCLSRQDLL